MTAQGYYTYIEANGVRFFTIVLLPHAQGRFPTVIFRSPYVRSTQDQTENDLTQALLDTYAPYLRRGYAVVYQHCRGQGKSTGEFVPYLHEREDGLFLRRWIREQDFYNGELFLAGASYGASLHYATAPFEKDVLGAVFEVQDEERYRLWYRNGQMRAGHANWHFGLYKAKCGLNKCFNVASFSHLPLKGLSLLALGETAEDFEKMLEAPQKEDPFWQTRLGGVDTRHAVDDANIPMLFTTGYQDYYIGGVFDMWRRLSARTKEKCALLVSPYNHGDGYHSANGLAFPQGKRKEKFGQEYPLDWLDHIRKNTPLPYQKGVITYYRCFENGWQSDFDALPTRQLALPMGKGTHSYCYDPQNAPAFGEEGVLQASPVQRADVLCVQTEPMGEEMLVKGRMQAELAVSCDCADTSVYMRVSIENEQGCYALRHDITSIGYQIGDYTPNGVISLRFCFDEYAFLLKKGDRLRIEIAGGDASTYVPHTNQKGPYHLQTEAKIAQSTVYLDKSFLILPVEQGKTV